MHTQVDDTMKPAQSKPATGPWVSAVPLPLLLPFVVVALVAPCWYCAAVNNQIPKWTNVDADARFRYVVMRGENGWQPRFVVYDFCLVMPRGTFL
jgi:hypothetical protein